MHIRANSHTADVQSFLKKIVNGENLQRAALSRAGNAVLQRIERQARPIF